MVSTDFEWLHGVGHRPFSLGVGNGSKCPLRDLARGVPGPAKLGERLSGLPK
jgi:hypothetical protein